MRSSIATGRCARILYRGPFPLDRCKAADPEFWFGQGSEQALLSSRWTAWVWACACLVGSIGMASAETLSGRYGPLLLAVRDGEARGVFSEGRVGNGDEDAPQFSCLFLLKGVVANERVDVGTWFPGEAERIAGVLDLGTVPSLKLAENHGGCLMTSGDMTTEPYRLGADERHPDWIDVGLVIAAKAILRPEPRDDPKRKRPYLVEFDAVAVLEQRAGWVRVTFVATDGPPTTGWLRGDEVATSAAAAP